MPNHDPLASRLGQLQSRGEGALVAYLTGGDPNPAAFLANASAVVEGGADILEIGIPFSDPIADGPVIQAASQRALDKGITPRKILALAKELSREHDIPLALLSYYNPILAMGAERFLRSASESGVSGLVIPDNPGGEDPHFGELAKKHSVDRILLAALNTPRFRLIRILNETSGFLYLVSLYGVTGPRKAMGPMVAESIRRIGSVNREKISVLAGFGVSSPEQIRSLVAAGADGAIVGSALVQIIYENLDRPRETERLLKKRVSELKSGTRKS